MHAVPAGFSFLRAGQAQAPVSIVESQENKKVETQAQACAFPKTVVPVLYCSPTQLKHSPLDLAIVMVVSQAQTPSALNAKGVGQPQRLLTMTKGVKHLQVELELSQVK
jgi:hypothetical protein